MFPFKRRKPEFTVCGSFAEAAALAGRGYGDDAIAAAVAERTARARDGDLPPLGAYQGEHIFLAVTYAACRTASEAVRVLDFGGACGMHALYATRTLPSVAQRWAVVETDVMLRHTARFGSDDLRFFDKVETAVEWLGGVDLVHTSSTLQYMPDPFATVAALTAIAAPVMLYQRTPFSGAATFHALQRAPLANHGHAGGRAAAAETLMPMTWMSRADFLATASAGYELVVGLAGRRVKIEGQSATFGEAYLFERVA